MRKIYFYLIAVITCFVFNINVMAEGKTLYAGIFDNSTYPGGIISFASSTPSNATHLANTTDIGMYAGAMANGKYYAMTQKVLGDGTQGEIRFSNIDFTTGAVGDLGAGTNLCDMTYDASTNTMYGLKTNFDYSQEMPVMTCTIYTINLTNGTLTPFHTIDGEMVLYGIAADSKGSLYTIGFNSFMDEDPTKLYKINLSNKEISPVGELTINVGFQGNNRDDFQSIEFDGDQLYWLGYSMSETKAFLATINTSTGAAERIGDIGEKGRKVGLCFSMTTDDGKTAYAAVAEPAMEDGGIVSFDLSSAGKIMPVITDTWTSTSAAAMAKGKYYAIVQNQAPEAYDHSKNFCTIDFTTNNKSILGSGADLLDMTYETSTEIMYGISVIIDDEDGNPRGVLSTVNLSNGELTQLYKFDNLLYAIAADGNGHLYAIGTDNISSEEGKLYEINLTQGTCTPKGTLSLDNEKLNFVFQDPDMLGQSMEFNEGKLYWLGQSPTKMLATIDIASGNVTKIGDTSYNSSLVGLCFSMTTGGSGDPEPEPENNTKTVTIHTYGDAMGATGLTKTETFFYDADNKLIRSILEGYDYGDRNIIHPMYYYTYKYDDKNQLTEKGYNQWGSYDGIYNAWQERDKETYEYNADGKLIKKIVVGKYYTYEWDGDNLIKECEYSLDKYNQYEEGDYYLVYQCTYSNFIQGTVNCPQAVAYTGKFDNYNGAYTYDDNHNKTSFVAKKPNESNHSKEEWKYDENGQLIEHIAYKVKNGEFFFKSKETYEIAGNKTTKRTYTYSEIYDEDDMIIPGEFMWYESPSYTVTITSECHSSLAPSNLSVSNVNDAVNTVLLTFDIPERLAIENPVWYVYREGTKVGIATFDNALNKYTYKDEMVPNGIYDYFVQTANSETGDLFNVSNVVRKDIFTELPVATNIRYLSHEIVTEDTYKVYKVQVGWDAPETDLEIKYYDVHMADNTDRTPDMEAVTDTSTKLVFGRTMDVGSLKQKIIVQTIYSIGRVDSEPVEINLDKIITSIENNSLEEKVQILGNMILINGNYSSLAIYGVNGMLINQYSETPMVDITSLQQGIYIVKVNIEGQVHTMKLIKR